MEYNSINPNLKVSDFDFSLPEELIAQHPVKPRDHSRLMVVNRRSGELTHRSFFNCLEYFTAGDVLILNDSKVIKARLFGNKPTGGNVEVFLLRQENDYEWECLTRGKRLAKGSIILFEDGISGELHYKTENDTWMITFNDRNVTRIGNVPLPPYITESSDEGDYQTVYAEHEGSVAAPTAGLHFTQELLNALESKGVLIGYVTLHVGLGTFLPVKTEYIKDHTMHSEYAVLPVATEQLIMTAKKAGKKIITVGTTSTRTVEAFQGNANQDWVNLFITPGYQFNTVDGMITNFHLPKSTLLMLVSAFVGKDHMQHAYEEAIKERYRFYSFGDAMLLL